MRWHRLPMEVGKFHFLEVSQNGGTRTVGIAGMGWGWVEGPERSSLT